MPSGSETAENVSLVQQAYTGATRQQWKITETANGSYKIKARSSESYTEKDLVMDIQYSLLYQNDNGIDIQQRAYLDNDSYMDEWHIVTHENNPYKLLALNEDGKDRDAYFSTVSGYIQAHMSFNILTDYFTTLYNKQRMIESLYSNEVFIIHTHGDKTGFMIDNWSEYQILIRKKHRVSGSSIK